MLPVRSTADAVGIVLPTLSMGLPLSAWYVRQVRTIALEQLSAPLRRGPALSRRFRASHCGSPCAEELVAAHFGARGPFGWLAFRRRGYRREHFQLARRWQFIGSAIGSRDYPVVQGYALLMALVYLIVNF